MPNYTLIHLHSDYSLLDSTTKFERYVDWAVEQGMTSIASSEHGVLYNWTSKKEYCDKKGIKYIHGVELYLTEKLYHTRMKVTENKDKTYQWNEVKQKQRDNYHIILLAKNYEGVKEINSLVSMANDDNHMYYKPRISFEEASKISDNVIISSACLASPLWSWKRTVMDYKAEIESIKAEILQWQSNKEKFIAELNGETTVRKKKRKPELIEADIQKCDDYLHNLIINTKHISADMEDITFNINNKEKWFTKLFYRYDYLEVQPHVNSNDQKEFNRWLLNMSKTYHKPIVCGTDTHSFDSYAAECRTIMQIAKGIEFLEEDTFDLTLKTCDELIQMFREQGVLSEEEIEIALNNTNVIADSVEDFELDKSFKYPISKSKEEDEKEFVNRCWVRLDQKIEQGIIDKSRRQEYVDRINEELTVFKKVGMLGFMLSMSDFIGDARNDGIPFGAGRGSAVGSCCAYITDITDVDPLVWHTIFSRFCNENRVEAGDIDIDVYEEDRDEVFRRIITRIGITKTAHVFALGTNQALGAIDDIGRALARKWVNENGKDTKELKIQKRKIQHSALTKEERKAQIDAINEQIKEIDKFNDKLNNPYSLKIVSAIKKLWQSDEQKCREKYPELCYYMDGIVDVKISASQHPAGLVASPITLSDSYGIMYNDGSIVLQLDMDAAHEVGLIKYDVLGLT